jgi:hypothetical protein
MCRLFPYHENRKDLQQNPSIAVKLVVSSTHPKEQGHYAGLRAPLPPVSDQWRRCLGGTGWAS